MFLVSVHGVLQISCLSPNRTVFADLEHCEASQVDTGV